jgi:hypothetical protein
MRCKLNIHNEIDCTGYPAALQDFFGAAILLSWFTLYNLGEQIELQNLGDLHRIKCGALQKLIATDPERESILQRAIHSQPPGLAIIFPGDVEGHRIPI